VPGRRLDDRAIRSRAGSSALLAALAALLVAACGSDRNAGARFQPAKPGVLTVATAFVPAPGFWEGRSADAGFEAALAKELARRLGLRSVAVRQVPFGSLVAGRLGGADLALSQLSPTDEREKSLDFTTPYLVAPAGVLAVRDARAADVKGLRGLRWVVSRFSTLTPIVKDEIRPDRAPVVVDDRAQALAVLRSGRADALLLDLPVALGLAHDDPAHFHVPGQLPADGDLAAALPAGSPNHEIVDSEIHRMQADGTIDKLVTRWLGEAEQDVPLIRTEE
jgi:polar amino acid transport system substrate-binding protein